MERYLKIIEKYENRNKEELNQRILNLVRIKLEEYMFYFLVKGMIEVMEIHGDYILFTCKFVTITGIFLKCDCIINETSIKILNYTENDDFYSVEMEV